MQQVNKDNETRLTAADCPADGGSVSTSQWLEEAERHLESLEAKMLEMQDELSLTMNILSDARQRVSDAENENAAAKRLYSSTSRALDQVVAELSRVLQISIDARHESTATDQPIAVQPAGQGLVPATRQSEPLEAGGAKLVDSPCCPERSLEQVSALVEDASENESALNTDAFDNDAELTPSAAIVEESSSVSPLADELSNFPLDVADEMPQSADEETVALLAQRPALNTQR